MKPFDDSSAKNSKKFVYYNETILELIKLVPRVLPLSQLAVQQLLRSTSTTNQNLSLLLRQPDRTKASLESPLAKEKPSKLSRTTLAPSQLEVSLLIGLTVRTKNL
jgi:hypothetical protein